MKQEIGTIDSNLLPWYQQKKRDLPWRADPSVYRVWISEVMLQQTRAETVVPYFLRFLDSFPDVFSLAEAPLDAVLKAWEGLGYYSRARHLHQAAKGIAEKKFFPSDRDGFLGLEGVGEYTAGAIASIALNQPVPAVDGNVLRVFSRLYAIPDDVSLGKTRKEIFSLVEGLIPEKQASNFNQALMELGATICLPRAPLCEACPLYFFCRAREAGEMEKYPITAKKKPPRRETWLAAIVEKEGKILLRRRSPEGLLGGLFEFPWFLALEESERALIQAFREETGLFLENCRPVMRLSQVFSHIRAEVGVYSAETLGGDLPADWLWVSPGDFENFPWTRIGCRIRAHFDTTAGAPMLGR
jgi:A/G-specific adenine glycosylase